MLDSLNGSLLQFFFSFRDNSYLSQWKGGMHQETGYDFSFLLMGSRSFKGAVPFKGEFYYCCGFCYLIFMLMLLNTTKSEGNLTVACLSRNLSCS